ncbi:MAG TPA: YcaO-like family protein [Bacteriovoracaceae bacterium]|nr:YcaO-like family protein [Bacteriovoracaceae bacterium]
MIQVLKDYFDKIKSSSSNQEIEYHIYNREDNSRMPFSVHLKFLDCSGIERNSWGSGLDKDSAFGKALMEMIERLYFTGFSPFEYKKLFPVFRKTCSLFQIANDFDVAIKHFHPANTNGIAIHSSKKKALQSALLELIERHVILSGLVLDINPNYKIETEVAKDKWCTFYIWESPLKSYTVVGSYTDNSGTYFSSGCDFDKIEAIAKAEMELSSFLFLTEKACTEFSIKKDDIQSFNRYHKYSGDHSAIRFLNNLSTKKIPELNKDLFYFTNIPLPQIFQGLPILPAVRVIHPDVQQLFFDNWSKEYLNPRIFLKDQVLPSFPHIIA